MTHFMKMRRIIQKGEDGLLRAKKLLPEITRSLHRKVSCTKFSLNREFKIEERGRRHARPEERITI